MNIKQKNKTLVVFYIAQEWDQCNRRPLITLLGKALPNTDFLVINRPGNIVPDILTNPKRLANSIKLAKVDVAQNVSVVRPMFFIHENLSGSFINNLNGYCLKYQLMKNCSFDSYEKIYQWIYYPHQYWIASKALNNSKFIYEIFDEYSLFHTGKKNNRQVCNEANIIKYIDIILCLNERILNNRKHYKKPIEVIGNGVSEAPVLCSENLFDSKKDKKVTLGIVGNIRNWIDFDLLEEVIKSNPDFELVFIGSIRKDVTKNINYLCSKYDNVKAYGSYKQEELQKLIRKIDIGLIPYKQNEFIKSTRPLKLLEFIACGIPVVTVPVCIEEYEKYSRVIRIATNSREFSKEIKSLALLSRSEIIGDCSLFIKNNTWTVVAERVKTFTRNFSF